MEDFVHRGVKIAQHGRRWRFFWTPTRRYVTTDTPEAATAELDRLVSNRVSERYSLDGDGCSVSRLIEEWWARKQFELRESSQLRYESVIRLHVLPRLGGLPAHLLRPLDIQNFYAHVTYKTALVSRDVLRPAFRWGMTNGFIKRSDGTNPFDLARLSRSACLDGNAEVDGTRTMTVDERLIPSRHEIEKLLIDAEEQQAWSWWLYLRMAPSLGARPGELCALQRKDLNDQQLTVSITKAANGATLKITPPKRSASVRSLYLGPEFFSDIAPVIDELEPESYLFPATGQNRGARILPCWNAHGVTGRLNRATARTAIPRYTPHSFRHYCATMLLDQGWPPMQVARWLGHRSDMMIRLLYPAHVVEETRTQMGSAAANLIRREAPERQS